MSEPSLLWLAPLLVLTLLPPPLSLSHASPTEYWVDSAANILAPGGSIQRIGYDQTSFDEAYRVVALEQSPTPLADDNNNNSNNNNNEAGPSSRIGIFEDERTNESEANRGDAAEPAKEGESSFKLNKDDLAYIVSSRARARAPFTDRRYSADRVVREQSRSILGR